jgi:hypothetical protein
MKTKHTKGEWTLVSEAKLIPRAKKGQHRVTIQSSKSDLLIGKIVGKDKEQAEANAKLIAAAPELLATLNDLSWSFEQRKMKGHKLTTREVNQLEMINEAIKKATL